MFEREEASARAEQQRRVVRQDTTEMEKLVNVIETVDEICFQKNGTSHSEGESSLAYLSSREYSNEAKSPDSFSTCPESVPDSNSIVSKDVSSIDARGLQDRIQAERDRVKMRRDKLQQQRSGATCSGTTLDTEENSISQRGSMDISTLNCLTISPFTSKTSLERDPIHSAYNDLLQSSEDNAEYEATADLEKNSHVSDPLKMSTSSKIESSTEILATDSLPQPSSKVQPLSTVTRKPNAMSLENRNRLIKWTCFFTLLIVIVITLVLVDKARDKRKIRNREESKFDFASRWRRKFL
jgi:hypothetical protein